MKIVVLSKKDLQIIYLALSCYEQESCPWLSGYDKLTKEDVINLERKLKYKEIKS
jgi:hypothetical protein